MLFSFNISACSFVLVGPKKIVIMIVITYNFVFNPRDLYKNNTIKLRINAPGVY